MPLGYISTPGGSKAKKRSSWVCIVELLRSWGLSHIGLGAGDHQALAQQRALPTWKKNLLAASWREEMRICALLRLCCARQDSELPPKTLAPKNTPCTTPGMCE